MKNSWNNNIICGFVALTGIILLAGLVSCSNHSQNTPVVHDTVDVIRPDTSQFIKKETITSVLPDSIVAFSRTLLGVPYLYASTDPEKGFDCSGFITYVFNHFDINVPRSSVDFTDYGKEIALENSKPGDLILFTGTDSTVRVVGHMGIIERWEDDTLYFIHATSGKGHGVVITPFENYYRSRYVKVVRVFPDDFFE